MLRPASRASSSRATARPRMPAPTTATSAVLGGGAPLPLMRRRGYVSAGAPTLRRHGDGLLAGTHRAGHRAHGLQGHLAVAVAARPRRPRRRHLARRADRALALRAD